MASRSEPADLSAVARRVEEALQRRRDSLVAPAIDERALRSSLAAFDFEAPRPLDQVAHELLALMEQFAVRSDHPRYFGLFNPPALPSAIAGDWIAAALNQQLAVWSHAPAATEIERKLIRLFGQRVWPGEEPAGSFTTGGSEANLTALLVALAHRYPHWHETGLPARAANPVIFVSSESHLAWIKIARICGLGSAAVRLVRPADGLGLSGTDLEQALAQCAGDPVLVVATAGTTAHGSIDELAGIARAGHARGAHVHVDAAWAGGVLLNPKWRHLLDGIEVADSVTLDPHKWLAVPMGAGMYLGRSWPELERAFGVTSGYMPAASSGHRDPYVHSVQWSRRFIGARLFTALSTLGLPGYRQMIDRQFALGALLRARLAEEGWRIVNRTELPLVCFVPDVDDQMNEAAVRAIEEHVIRSGTAWISSATLQGHLALRACITSFETTEQDVEQLVHAVGDARAAVRKGSA